MAETQVTKVQPVTLEQRVMLDRLVVRVTLVAPETRVTTVLRVTLVLEVMRGILAQLETLVVWALAVEAVEAAAAVTLTLGHFS